MDRNYLGFELREIVDLGSKARVGVIGILYANKKTGAKENVVFHGKEEEVKKMIQRYRENKES